MSKDFIQDDSGFRFFITPIDIFEVPDIDWKEQMVYIVLRSYTGPRDATAFPSYTTIARLGRMSRDSAIRAVKGLIEKGLLQKEIRFDVTKDRKIKNASNLYKIKNPKKARVVAKSNQGSRREQPPLVAESNQGSRREQPDLDLNDQDPIRSRSNNQDQSVNQVTINDIKSASVRKVVQNNKKMTDRLTDIVYVYSIIRTEEGYSDALFLDTLRKAVKARISVSFADYLLKAMIKNLNAQKGNQMAQNVQKKDKPGKLPQSVLLAELEQAQKEVAAGSEKELEEKRQMTEELLRQLDAWKI